MTRSNRFIRTSVAFATVSAAFVLLALAGCGSKPPAPSVAPASSSGASAFPVTVSDDASTTITIAAAPKRIVSLAPANTEIAFALGLGDRVVGVTTYDDFPAGVKSIARIGDFTTPNIEAIAAARPDLILATTGVQADALKRLKALGATVLALDPQTLDGVYTDIARVGEATGTRDKAAVLIGAMKSDVADVQKAVGATAPATAFVEIAQNPLYTVGSGTLIDELIKLAGGTNVVTEPGYVAYSSEQLIKADPQVYLATKGSMSDPAALAKRAGYAKLQAVTDNRVIILDDNLVSRPGPRIVEGLKQIAAGLHPDAFPGN
jgi:iron complex transport system substrate-binding protein